MTGDSEIIDIIPIIPPPCGTVYTYITLLYTYRQDGSVCVPPPQLRQQKEWKREKKNRNVSHDVSDERDEENVPGGDDVELEMDR